MILNLWAESCRIHSTAPDRSTPLTGILATYTQSRHSRPRRPTFGTASARHKFRGNMCLPEGWRSCPGSSFSTPRSEEHTSELQSLRHLVCRLLLEKKKHT